MPINRDFKVECSIKDLKREITFAWYYIGEIWLLDETDEEVFSRN